MGKTRPAAHQGKVATRRRARDFGQTVVTALLVVVLSSTGNARAQPPDTVFLAELTWTELRDAIAQGKTTVLLPTGGTEQNGPHMALGKHNVIVRHASAAIARRLGNALVAPVIAYVPQGDVDPPSGHMRFPGTLTLPEEHFRKLVEYAVRSLDRSGFTDIVLLGDSGGNWAGLAAVAQLLNREWSDGDTRVHYVSAYNRGQKFRHWLQAQGEAPERIGSHAGIMDTSVMLAVDPTMVRPDKLAPGGDFDHTGVLGDPTRARAAYGRKGLEIQIEDATAEIIAVTTRD